MTREQLCRCDTCDRTAATEDGVVPFGWIELDYEGPALVETTRMRDDGTDEYIKHFCCWQCLGIFVESRADIEQRKRETP